MNIQVTAPITVFENSLAAARATGLPNLAMPRGAAPAVLDAALMGQLSQCWESIERALWQGYLRGKAAAEELLTSAATGLETVLDEAGIRVNLAQAWLQQRVHTFAATFISGALALVPIQRDVGGTAFVLSTFNCTQTVSLSGNLKTSLIDLLTLVCEGQINIEANYTRQV